MYMVKGVVMKSALLLVEMDSGGDPLGFPQVTNGPIKSPVQLEKPEEQLQGQRLWKGNFTLDRFYEGSYPF